MAGSVRLQDGVQVSTSDDRTVAFDGNQLAGDVNVVSHAHGDHLPSVAGQAVCSPLTAALAAVRGSGDQRLYVTSHPAVDLQPAGHVAGSCAAVLTDRETGTRYCYTGDVCTRDRYYLEGFDPPDADVLIVEATYGKPGYVFPDHQSVVEEIHEWLAETMDVPVILFGYALGRAQKLERIVAESARDRLLVTDAIAAINDVIEAHCVVTFGADRYDRATDLGAGDALVLPMSTGRLDWIEQVVEETDGITAGFSGWAVDQSFVYRRGLDRGFPLSDHCDFEELLDLVRAVNPERAYTQHGFADELATQIERRLGIEATSLKRNQTTLGEF